MIRPLAFCLAALLVTACGPTSPEAQQAQQEKMKQGRAETKGIRNTQSIGVAGNAIADKVDAALDATEKRNKELQQQSDPNAAPPQQ